SCLCGYCSFVEHLSERIRYCPLFQSACDHGGHHDDHLCGYRNRQAGIYAYQYLDQLFYLYDGVVDPAFFRRRIQLYHHGADLQYDWPCGIQAAVYRTGTETADQGDRSETGRAQDVAYPGTVRTDQPE